MWARHNCWGEEGCFSISIWSEEYYKRYGYVCDQCTYMIMYGDIDDHELTLYDGTWEKGPGREIGDLGYDESSESTWTGPSWGCEDDMQPLIDYLEKHPRFKHCPELE
jgi:hypothetical protein